MTAEVKFVIGALLFTGAASAAAIALDRKNIGEGAKEQAAAATAQQAEVAADPAAAKQGEALYTSLGCIACHSVDGSMRVGPSFAGLYGRTEKLTSGETVKADQAYLTESIKDPSAKIVSGFVPTMPAYPNMQNSEVDALIQYIRTLK